MKNRDIYQQDPTTRKLVNEGVANVNDDRTSQALAVLRYELETFVCDGQYHKGMAHILETYLKNIHEAQQPAVWVSGFYGSGKSHLVKMLRALWQDTKFEDGATARGIASDRLPQDVCDSLKELDTQARRHGGLHAASGTLGASASGSVRLALLGIVFKSAGLPEQYHLARFVMWLREEGIETQVREQLGRSGHDWEEELANFYVAEGLHEALVEIKPNLFPSPASCVETLNNLYPYVQDISSNEMLNAMRQALTRDGKFPLTLVVLDEVQQYIGDDSQRSMDVQEVVESCCKNIGGRLLFIGTGQTALSSTANLKRLEGRFTIRVELSDDDVEAVIRQVILAKKPEAKAPIEQVMQTNLGEISRHLAGTSIAHSQDDESCFAQDYPILPVRRRFWEITLRGLDQTGTESQLRNQLSMVHKAIKTNLGEPLGHVLPADYLYFDSADKLLQSRNLPRNVHELTMKWNKGSAEDRLRARASGLIFLINKIAGQNEEVGVKATADTLADLMVEDLSAGSGNLRGKLPGLLDECNLLMKVGEEYRIQTEESAAWDDEFQNQQAVLSNEAHRIEAERDDRIRRTFSETVRKLSLTQGNAAVNRDIHPLFDPELPRDADKRIYVWVRNGWHSDENSVRAEARQAGTESPTVFAFIPKRSADDLRRQLIEYKAAIATLERRGVPGTAAGEEARAAMETTKQRAEGKIRELLGEAFSGARVFQGGGNEIGGIELQEMILEASRSALLRLYPQFQAADHSGFSRSYDMARKGAPDALKAVAYEGEPAKHPVCKTILGFIAGGKSGTDIRDRFESPPYGWSRDAVDGGLQVLLVAGLIRAHDQRGQATDPKQLERKAIGKAVFKVESATVTARQRIDIRKLLQKADLKPTQGKELEHVPQFLEKMQNLAQQAGGESPKPEPPSTTSLEEIRRLAGNEQLLALHNQREELHTNFETWTELGKRIEKRWPKWQEWQRLASYSGDLKGFDALQSQMTTIEQQRQLLDEPDPVAPLLSSLTNLLREQLNTLDAQFNDGHKEGMQGLGDDGNWKTLKPEQRNELLSKQKLTKADWPKVDVQSSQGILTTLDRCRLSALADRVAALPNRFGQVAKGAAKLCEPSVQYVALPRRTLKTFEEIDAWAEEAKVQLKAALDKGPVWLK